MKPIALYTSDGVRNAIHIFTLVSYGLILYCFFTVSRAKLHRLPVFFRGSSPSEGSEHTINGLYGAGEAHFVFTNVRTKQLAVLAFFIVMSTDQSQNAWGSYVDNAVTLIREGTQIQFVANLMQLMETENNFRDFWRYNGSLTTPPCTEGVICK